MCSISKVNEMLAAINTFSPVGSSSPSISAVKLKHNRDTFLLVDIREPEELESEPLPKDITADDAVSMGKIFHLAHTGAFDEWKDTGKNKKTIVLLCATGTRASITAPHLISCGFNAKYLSRGLLGLLSPAAIIPDFVVVLGVKDNAEKLTLAMNACAVAASNGETSVLVLMGDGVCTFLRKGNNKDLASDKSFRVQDTFIGDPFKTCPTLLAKFLSTGNGVILACSSCVQSRNIEFGSDLLDCVEPMQMPDLIRMMGEAKKNLQFI